MDKFLGIRFVQEHDKWGPDLVDLLQAALKITKHLSWRDIVKLPLRKLQKVDEDYVDAAFNEMYMRRHEAEFVVYGHTHQHKVQPLDVVLLEKKPALRQIYFNSGTWRVLHEHTARDKENQEFISRHVMTFVAFYAKSERKRRRFEVWSGTLDR